MTTYLVAVYAHLVAAVLYVGYFLFWVIMARGLATTRELEDADTYMERIHRAHWPPEGMPGLVRLPFHGLGWVFWVALIASGGLVVALVHPERAASPEAGGSGWILGAKILLVGVLGLVHAGQLRGPSARLGYFGGITLTGVVVLSAWLVR